MSYSSLVKNFDFELLDNAPLSSQWEQWIKPRVHLISASATLMDYIFSSYFILLVSFQIMISLKIHQMFSKSLTFYYFMTSHVGLILI